MSIPGFESAVKALRLCSFVLTVFLMAGEVAPPMYAEKSSPASQPAFPAVGQLPEINDLPDPLLRMDGTRITSAEDWMKHRGDLQEMIQYYQYGHLPLQVGKPGVEDISTALILAGKATEMRKLLLLGPGKDVKMLVRLVIPEGNGPWPCIVHNTNSVGHIPIEAEILSRGYMIAEYLRTDLDPDQNDVVGPAQAAYPEYDWATLAVWAWGAMRVADYVTTLPFVDAKKLAVTGHSRGGKTALLAGALDDRFALVVPNGSGCGGAGCYRIQGEKSETLAQITDPQRFSYWFHPRFREFADKETRIPFDQHFLKALVAPRALLSTDAYGDLWANPAGTQATYLAAQPVFDLLGVPQNNAIHFRQGKHEQNAEDWTALIDYADQGFSGKANGVDFKKLPFPEKVKNIPGKP